MFDMDGDMTLQPPSFALPDISGRSDEVEQSPQVELAPLPAVVVQPQKKRKARPYQDASTQIPAECVSLGV
jgi:hypothetical protein